MTQQSNVQSSLASCEVSAWELQKQLRCLYLDTPSPPFYRLSLKQRLCPVYTVWGNEYGSLVPYSSAWLRTFLGVWEMLEWSLLTHLGMAMGKLWIFEITFERRWTKNVILLDTEYFILSVERDCAASRMCLSTFFYLFICILFINKVYSSTVQSLLAWTLLYSCWIGFSLGNLHQ